MRVSPYEHRAKLYLPLHRPDQLLDPVALARTLRDRLKEVFGDRLRGVVLYGSRARGDAAVDSDIDFLVLLDRVESFKAERKKISPIACDLSLEHELAVSALPVSEAAFDSEETPLFLNARREGIVVR